MPKSTGKPTQFPVTQRIICRFIGSHFRSQSDSHRPRGRWKNFSCGSRCQVSPLSLRIQYSCTQRGQNREFSTGEGNKSPTIHDVILSCESSPKPVVAGIHGTALGGGFEIALACHWRIGVKHPHASHPFRIILARSPPQTSRCQVGFPEVLIGILPGAGGTQRFPRLVGGLLAAEIIATGQFISGQRAKDIGALDHVVHIEPTHSLEMEQSIIRQAAIRYAIQIANKPLGPRIISKRKCEKVDSFFYDGVEFSPLSPSLFFSVLLQKKGAIIAP